MNSPMDIVVSLEQAKALVEHGLKLKTVFSYAPIEKDFRDVVMYPMLTTDAERNTVWTLENAAEYGENFEKMMEPPVPAPVLSELLDVIRSLVPRAQFRLGGVYKGIDILQMMQVWFMNGESERHAFGKNDIDNAVNIILQLEV